MSGTHPVFVRPVIHCGKCERPLILPRKRTTDAEDIAAGRAVLAECTVCAVAVQVPAAMFKPSAHTHIPTTIARPWPEPKAILTSEQRAALGWPSQP